jgi:hypothetical protein
MPTSQLTSCPLVSCLRDEAVRAAMRELERDQFSFAPRALRDLAAARLDAVEAMHVFEAGTGAA